LEVLTHYPAVVRTLVPHEPAAVRQLPDGQEWVNFFFDTYDLYHQSGTAPAQQQFAEQILTVSDRQSLPPPPANGEPILVNTTHWFERELRQYPVVDLDLDVLKAYAGRIVPAAGVESRGYPIHEVTVRLAPKLDRDLVELPGGSPRVSVPTRRVRKPACAGACADRRRLIRLVYSLAKTLVLACPPGHGNLE
jgi:acetyltransferase/esterase